MIPYISHNIVKTLHEERLKDLGVLPRRQVEFRGYSPLPGLRQLVQTLVRTVALAIPRLVVRSFAAHKQVGERVFAALATFRLIARS